MRNFIMHREDDGGYSRIPLSLINDPDLSLEAKGLLVWMISRPPTWSFSVAGMVTVLNDGRNRNGRTSIETAMRQLEDVGYLRVISQRVSGRFMAIYHIYDHRITAAEEAALSAGAELSAEPVAAAHRAAKEAAPGAGSGIVERIKGAAATVCGSSTLAHESSSHRCGFSASVNRQQDYKRKNRLDNNPSLNTHCQDSAPRPQGIADAGQGGDGEKSTVLDDRQQQAFQELSKRSINRNFSVGRYEEMQLFSQRVSDGYRPEQVLLAYDRYVSRYRDEHPDTTRYAMRLANWLSERGDGISFDLRLPKGGHAVGQGQADKPEEKDVYQLCAEADAGFAEKYDEYMALFPTLAKMTVRGQKADADSFRSRIDVCKGALDRMAERLMGTGAGLCLV